MESIQTPGTPARLAGVKRVVLVVDDNLINRRILSKILEDDYEILQAENGLQALRVLRAMQDNEVPVSMILLDIMMPVMDGYAFLAEYSKDPHICNIPVVVTTQSSGDENEIRALAAGAMDFLTKPYKPEIILHRVKNLISMRENAALIARVQTDPLTGVLTRDFYYQRAEQYIQRHAESELCLVCVDMDSFKLINEVYGFQVGDQLLCYIASLLKDWAGDGAYGRLGDDRFSYVARAETVQRLAENYDAVLEQVNRFPVSAKIVLRSGVFPIKDRGMSVSMMCDRAQMALETSKGKYGEYCRFYSDEDHQKLLQDQMIVNEMERALAENQFKVYFQPKCELKTGKLVGAEGLVRWIHPEKGVISPGAFIPLFEKNGFIVRLDRHVWEQTCRILADWLARGLPAVPVSVNVSRAHVHDPELLSVLVGLREKYGIPHELLHLEITESAYTDNPTQLIAVAQQLREQGFIIEMDDFGTGYSSLNMLARLPVNVLKLDMSFLRDDSNATNKIMSFIINLADWLELSVISEGVETREQVERLSAMGCQYGQGYLFSRPIPSEEFERLLIRGEAQPKG